MRKWIFRDLAFSIALLFVSFCIVNPSFATPDIEHTPIINITNTPSIEEEWGLSWSPDGSKLAFTNDTHYPRQHDIAIINSDGTGYLTLTSSYDSEMYPHWSPDGSKIAYYRREAHWVMNADGSNQRQVTFNLSDQQYTPRWSPDSTLLLFSSQATGRQELYTVNVNTLERKQLTFEGGAFPNWSPDGSKIVFLRQIGPQYDILIMNADGSNQVNLTQTSDREEWPSWFPDGSKIIFNRIRGEGEFGMNWVYEIWTMNSDGTEQTCLGESEDGLGSNPYSFDGKFIAFTRYSGSTRSLWVMRNEGYDLTRIEIPNSTTYAAVYTQRWSPVDYRLGFLTDTFFPGYIEIAVTTIFETNPDISVTPNPVPFGSVNVGATSDQIATIKNDGNANLVVGTITSPDQPFSKIQDNCSGQTITPKSTCTVMYRFSPTTSGNYSSNSNIPSNDPDENPVTVSLNGVGVTETITVPNILTGAVSGTTGVSYSYATGGSTSSLGHSVQYFFDWGDGTNSGWLTVGTTSESKSWPSAGTYSVKAKARCATDTGVESNWSTSLSVTISGGNGVISLPQTGQTKCYDSLGAEINCSGTGQDGESQVGVEWPEPRFTVSGDCVTDNLTGLMWTKNGNLPNGTRSWQGALDYVVSINSGSGLCGYKDWRLPNINELESLVNADETNSAAWLNSQGFSNVQSNFYWSSTTNAVGTDRAWGVSMWSGGVDFNDKSDKSYYSHVWPVRSGQGSLAPSAIWKTGQTTSYASGDDGDLEKGIAWPSPRFIDHGNGTVTDNLTGLMWTKNSNLSGGEKTWQETLDYVKTLNTGGYSDWRLPNRKDLFSLIDHSTYDPALPAKHPFQNVQSLHHHYWSSTSTMFYQNTHSAWVVYMWDGAVDSDYKSRSHDVWPVRSGQGPLGYPDISVTPNPVEFGSVNVGATSEKQVIVKNDGNANLIIGTITSPSLPFSKIADNCSGQTFAPSASCTVTYQFSPTSAGSFSSNSNIPSNDPDENPVTLTLNGIGITSPESVSAPTTLSGPPTGVTGTSYSFTTGGSTSSLGDTVEYQFDWKGDGTDLSSWGSATQSKTWTTAGTYTVKARARCATHTSVISGWSSGLTVTISAGVIGIGTATRDLPDCYTPSVPSTVNIIVTPSVTANNYRVVETVPNGWTVSDINENGWWDNEFYNWVRWYFRDKNNRTLTYKATPPSGETGSKTFSGIVVFDEDVVTIGGDSTIEKCPPETVSIPNVPSGPTSGSNGISYSYTTGGSTSNLGHSLEYQFDWKGDGSDLSSWGSATQSKSWTLPGTYNVRARARCATDTSVVSGWSSGLSVTIVGGGIATRDLPDCYTSSVTSTVTISVTPSGTTQTYALEDIPPSGWTVGPINEWGLWDDVNKKVKWGPFFDHNTRTLTYQVTPPVGETGTKSFSGAASFDGVSAAIGGESTIDKCTCTFHPADTNNDSRISMDECTAYGSAWKTGQTWPTPPNPIPIEYVTNGGYLWRMGEVYHCDSTKTPPWVPGPVPGSEVQKGRIVSEEGLALLGMGSAIRDLPDIYTPSVPVSVSISVSPNSATLVYAVQDTPPVGWVVSNINEDGQWDSVNKKVKWGPFFDSNIRTLTYQATPLAGESGTKAFYGVGSFDGTNVVIGGESKVGNTAISHAWDSLPGQTVSPAALAWNPVANKLQMVVKAADDSIWMATFNSSGVFNNDWTSIPGATASAPALAWNPMANKLQMVVRASNDSIWAGTFNSGGAFNNDWAPIPGATSSAPALAWNPVANELQIAVRASNDSIWTGTFNASGVFNNDWAPIPGNTPSSPALAWNPVANKLQMVVRASNDSIWAGTFYSSGVFNNDWAPIPGATSSAPALAWDALLSRLCMVVRAGDSSIWFSTFDSSGNFNNDWVNIPGSTPSSPGMAYFPYLGRLGIAVRASDDSLWGMLY